MYLCNFLRFLLLPILWWKTIVVSPPIFEFDLPSICSSFLNINRTVYELCSITLALRICLLSIFIIFFFCYTKPILWWKTIVVFEFDLPSICSYFLNINRTVHESCSITRALRIFLFFSFLFILFYYILFFATQKQN